jgi:predicted adenine nucleotide alpha hydrolase (AANH) superfamily ATPase
LRVIYQEGYDLERFIRGVAYREANRCDYCYHERLKSTALFAKRGKFDYFTTTLLYSKYQKHDNIKSIGEAVGKSVGLPFLYNDFRPGWWGCTVNNIAAVSIARKKDFSNKFLGYQNPCISYNLTIFSGILPYQFPST